MRAAIDRALRADLKPTELRVFLAVVALIPMFDKPEDRIANHQLAEATDVDGRHVRRALARLHELGVIEREPGASPKGGRRVASLIRIPTGGESRPSSSGEQGAESAPYQRPRPGADFDTDRGQISTRTGGNRAPASESLSESPSEKGTRRRTLAERNAAAEREFFEKYYSELAS